MLRYTMTIGQTFLQELTLEAAVTRRYLDSVPFDKLDFKPTEKSETLGRLAIHVAEIVAWWTSCVEDEKLDFIDFEPADIKTKDELLAYFDHLLAGAKTSLANAPDAVFEKEWSMTHGDEILFTLPKGQVARLFCMNHLVHHRAQLGIYLRLLDVPVPATYGPSADDEDVILIQPFQ
ncbi:MAG: DinB family protein [Bacteroidota bacterium]